MTNYTRVGDMDYLSGGTNRNVCSTSLTERRPLKRCRQIPQHRLIRPNLRFIIVPQPCRKRSVTLRDNPPVTFDSSLFPSVLCLLPPGTEEINAFWEYAVFRHKTIYLALFSQLTLKESFVLFLFARLLSPRLWLYVEHGFITSSSMLCM